jgi:hypothetical protein
MNDKFKDVIMQLRYPYTAGVIAVMWIGMAILGNIRDDLQIETVISVAAVLTLVVASIGFSSVKR